MPKSKYETQPSRPTLEKGLRAARAKARTLSGRHAPTVHSDTVPSPKAFLRAYGAVVN